MPTSTNSDYNIIINSIIQYSPEHWVSAMEDALNSVENKQKFIEDVSAAMHAKLAKQTHICDILRRGPALDPELNPRAFKMMLSRFLARLFIKHPNLCNRLCTKIKNDAYNPGIRDELAHYKVIDENKNQVEADVERACQLDEAQVEEYDTIVVQSPPAEAQSPQECTPTRRRAQTQEVSVSAQDIRRSARRRASAQPTTMPSPLPTPEKQSMARRRSHRINGGTLEHHKSTTSSLNALYYREQAKHIRYSALRKQNGEKGGDIKKSLSAVGPSNAVRKYSQSSRPRRSAASDHDTSAADPPDLEDSPESKTETDASDVSRYILRQDFGYASDADSEASNDLVTSRYKLRKASCRKRKLDDYMSSVYPQAEHKSQAGHGYNDDESSGTGSIIVVAVEENAGEVKTGAVAHDETSRDGIDSDAGPTNPRLPKRMRYENPRIDKASPELTKENVKESTGEEFTLRETIDAMEFVAENPWLCGHALVHHYWDHYKVFRDYINEAEEEEKEELLERKEREASKESLENSPSPARKRNTRSQMAAIEKAEKPVRKIMAPRRGRSRHHA